MPYRLAVISPNEQLTSLFQEYKNKMRKDIQIIRGNSRVSLSIAESLTDQGIEVIISRGGTAKAIRNARQDIAIVEVPITAFDLLRAVKSIPENITNIVIAGYGQFTYGIEENENLLNKKIRTITLESSDDEHLSDAEKELERLYIEGWESMAGDTILCAIAEKIGYRTTLVTSGKQAVIQAVSEAENLAEMRRFEIERSERFRSITQYSTEGILSVDSNGTIDLFNPSAEKILGISSHTVLGKQISHILPEFTRHFDENRENQFDVIVKSRKGSLAINIISIVVNKEIVRRVITFQDAARVQNLETKIRRNLAEKGLIAVYNFQDLIGEDELMNSIKEDAEEYASVDSPVLIYGETGTGKELFAQAIHNASPRAKEPFVAFNCAALASSLIESELFGYTEGAFTGARKGGKAGLFEQAHKGTIFLDEIGEIDKDLQVRLLRVLEERKVRRIGDNRLTPVDVRVIVATNKELRRMVEEQKFREDLYYRINVLNLSIPSLRERRNDIPLLADYLVKKINNRLGKSIKGFSAPAYDLLKSCKWPGNVRQLENLIERMIILSKKNVMDDKFVINTIGRDLGYNTEHQVIFEDSHDKNAHLEIDRPKALPMNLTEFEDKLIKKVLISTKGNRTLAAEILGIGRTTLWRKMKLLGLTDDQKDEL